MLIPASTTNQMHVLRHFLEAPQHYARVLLGKPYEYYDLRKKKFIKATVTKRAIKKAVRTRGKSKFFSGLARLETPRKVIGLVKNEAKKRRLRWTDQGAYRTAKFTFMHPILVGIDISTRSKRKTRRIGVEIAWYKGTRSAYITAYPCFYD